jgi:hypothetical protein
MHEGNELLEFVVRENFDILSLATTISFLPSLLMSPTATDFGRLVYEPLVEQVIAEVNPPWLSWVKRKT